MGKKKEGFHWLVDILCIFIIIFGLLLLSSYYFDFYLWVTEFIIVGVMIILSIDSFFYSEKDEKNRSKYIFLGVMFFTVVIFHLIRSFIGPYWCDFSLERISFYLYELFAITLGIVMTSVGFSLIKSSKRKNYFSYAAMFIGIAIAINHIVKIFIGKCV